MRMPINTTSMVGTTDSTITTPSQIRIPSGVKLKLSAEPIIASPTIFSRRELIGNDNPIARKGFKTAVDLVPDRPTVGCELRRTRYDIIMKGFGGEGENIETLDEIGPAVQRAFASGRPYLLNVNIRGARSPFTEWQIAGKK